MVYKLVLGFLIYALFFLASCGDVRQLTYMQGTIDTVALSKINYIEPVIQKGDILSILVYSDNQLASAYFNQTAAANVPGSSGVSGAIGSLPVNAGYEVNQDGKIQFFGLGLTIVEGLTRKQLADQFAQRLVNDSLLRNAYVEVKFLNFKITVLGDVARPGPVTFPSEKVTILDALGQAGDLTTYGKRDNVLVIREIDNKRSFVRLDLTKPDVIKSPYFYLRQNDLIIVDPVKQKAVANDQSLRYITIVTSLVSVVAIVISIFR